MQSNSVCKNSHDHEFRGSNAFTLLELVLVLTIVATVSSVVAMRYATASVRYRTDVTARQIILDLALARSEARHRSTMKTVVFDLLTNSYTIPEVADLRSPDGSGADYKTDLAGEPYHARLVSVDFGGSAKVVFDGFGNVDNGGTIVVGVGDVQKTIVLNGDTGIAAVQ